jgi:hypothetical protein
VVRRASSASFQLLAQPDPPKVLVLPRPLAEIMKSKSELETEDARLVHRFYELLASEIRSSGR